MSFWRLMLWISLVAVSSGSLTRQAEAASDLARTMAESGEGHRLEEVDGGVGDDSLEATRGDAAELASSPIVEAERSGSGDWPDFPFGTTIQSSRGEPGPPTISRVSARSGRRQAWLGRFLF